MTASTITAASSTGLSSRPEFWEFLWRSAGLQAVALIVVAAFLHGLAPPVGAGPDALIDFYAGNQLRLLISASLTGLAVLNLLWFSASVKITLAEAGKDGWGTAVTASSATFGGLLLLATALEAALSLSLSNAPSPVLALGLGEISSSLLVLLSFPRAMLIMSVAFGLWRAKLISNALFSLGVILVVLGLLGGTTWMGVGFWSPDGAFARFISPSLLLLWVMLASGVLFARHPTARSGW